MDKDSMDMMEKLDALATIVENIRSGYEEMDEDDKKHAEDCVENAIVEVEDWE